MCADHIDAIGDPKLMQRAAPAINQVLSAAEVKSWSTCGEGNVVSGVCGLLLNKQHGSTLWKAAGAERERNAYAEFSDQNFTPSKAVQEKD